MVSHKTKIWFDTQLITALLNVCRVKGVGPKTAVKLLRQFGTLDGIIAGAEDIKGKVVKNALTSEQGVEAARLSKELVTLDCDIEKERLFHGSLESDMRFRRPDDCGKELLELFEMYDFKSLIPRVEKIWEQLDKRP
jgi:DNA polymerase-1